VSDVTSTTGAFKVGDDVSAIRSTSIRVRPGAAQTASTTAASGTAMQITVAPVETTSEIWYGVQGSFGGGWVAESDIQAAAAPPSGGLAVGDPVRVTEILNMRTGAGTGNAIIATLPAGTRGKVVDGPRSANGFTWYRIETGYGTGWVASDWL